MLKLDVGELEALVDQIPDPLLRAREGMDRFRSDSEQSEKYSALYIQTLMNGEDRTKREFRDDDAYGSDPTTQAFKGLSEDRRAEIGKEYLQWRFDSMSEETSDGALKQIASLAKEIGLESHVSTIAQPYVNDRFASLQDVSGKTDETAMKLAGVAQTLGLVDETKEAATQYFQRRLEGIQDPTSTDAFGMTNLFSFANTYGLSQEGELTDLYLATSFFAGDRWGFAADKLPKVTKENEREAIQRGWQIAQNLWQNTGSATGLGKLFRNEKFQSEYGSDETARAIAKGVVAETLKGSYGIEEAKSLVETYNLSDLNEIVGEGIRANLQEGNYQVVSQIGEVFGYGVTDEMYDTARATIERRASDAIQEGKLEEAIGSKLKLKAFDDYRANGLDIESIPEIDIPEGYSGKVLVLQFQGRNYIRTLPRGRSMHSDISEAFGRELSLRGFSGWAEEMGGGDFYWDKSGQGVISGESGDYGECDKELARGLVQKAFPDKTIVAHQSRNSGW